VLRLGNDGLEAINRLKHNSDWLNVSAWLRRVAQAELEDAVMGEPDLREIRVGRAQMMRELMRALEVSTQEQRREA
jgi:hypothetical protein